MLPLAARVGDLLTVVPSGRYPPASSLMAEWPDPNVPRPVQIPGTWGRYLTWRKGLCRGELVKTCRMDYLGLLGGALNVITWVLLSGAEGGGQGGQR